MSRKNLTALTLSMGLVLLSSCAIVNSYRALYAVKSARANQQGVYFELPYEDRQGYVVIPVQIGNRTYRYILDTGAYGLTVTDDVIQANQLPTRQTVQLGSANQLKSEVRVVRVPELRLDQLRFFRVGAFNLNFDKAPSIRCLSDGGLIGTSMLRHYIWQIDKSRQRIIVTDQLSRLPQLEQAVRLPITFDKRGLPFVSLLLNGQPERVLLDTGAGTLLSLSTGAAQKRIGTVKVLEQVGAASEGAHGVKPEPVHVFALQSCRIGSLQLNNLPVSYLASNKYSLLGNELLTSHILTLNYRDKELYLTPIAGQQPPEGLAGFGLTLGYDQGKTIVKTLYKDSPAWLAGIQLGDEVRSIDGQNVVFADFCACFLNSPQLLKNKPQAELVLQREQQFFTATLKHTKLL